MNEDLIDRLLPLQDGSSCQGSIEDIFKNRELQPGAMVTRFAPSPTGFMHLGGVYVSLINKVMAQQSGGVFFLRIEDTDIARSNYNGIRIISDVLNRFNLIPDEGVIKSNGDKSEQYGDYGPYIQTERKNIYHFFARELLRRGYAYPCFMSQGELEDGKLKQIRLKKGQGVMLSGLFGAM